MNIYRPSTLKDIIGQEKMKEHLRILLGASMKEGSNMPHMIMAGPPGLGKTTFAKVLAYERGVDMYWATANDITSCDQLRNLIVKLSCKGYHLHNEHHGSPDGEPLHPDILFLDEIHELGLEIEELLYTVMEDYEVTVPWKNPSTGRNETVVDFVPRFTLIGATTRLGDLSKPFRDRFPVKLYFDYYSLEECKAIAIRAAKIAKVSMTEEALDEIARRSKGTPREVLSLFELCRQYAVATSENDINIEVTQRAFESAQIDSLGLNTVEVKILKMLHNAQGATGVVSIASALEERVQTVQNHYEPFLVRSGLIERTSQGRILTEMGRQHLIKIKAIKENGHTGRLRRENV